MIRAYSTLPNNRTPDHKFSSRYALFYRSYLQKQSLTINRLNKRKISNSIKQVHVWCQEFIGSSNSHHRRSQQNQVEQEQVRVANKEPVPISNSSNWRTSTRKSAAKSSPMSRRHPNFPWHSPSLHDLMHKSTTRSTSLPIAMYRIVQWRQRGQSEAVLLATSLSREPVLLPKFHLMGNINEAIFPSLARVMPCRESGLYLTDSIISKIG